MRADNNSINKTVASVLNSETATDVFSRTYSTVKQFDPNNIPKLLQFIQKLVAAYSRLTEPYKVEIDGMQIGFANRFEKKPDNLTAHFKADSTSLQ